MEDNGQVQYRTTESVKSLILNKWGTIPLDDLLAEAAEFVPAINRDRLRAAASNLRRAGHVFGRYVENKEWIKWTEGDSSYVKSHAGLLSVGEMAKKLGRTEHSIIQFAKRGKISLMVHGEQDKCS